MDDVIVALTQEHAFDFDAVARVVSQRLQQSVSALECKALYTAVASLPTAIDAECDLDLDALLEADAHAPPVDDLHKEDSKLAACDAPPVRTVAEVTVDASSDGRNVFDRVLIALGGPVDASTGSKILIPAPASRFQHAALLQPAPVTPAAAAASDAEDDTAGDAAYDAASVERMFVAKVGVDKAADVAARTLAGSDEDSQFGAFSASEAATNALWNSLLRADVPLPEEVQVPTTEEEVASSEMREVLLQLHAAARERGGAEDGTSGGGSRLREVDTGFITRLLSAGSLMAAAASPAAAATQVASIAAVPEMEARSPPASYPRDIFAASRMRATAALSVRATTAPLRTRVVREVGDDDEGQQEEVDASVATRGRHVAGDEEDDGDNVRSLRAAMKSRARVEVHARTGAAKDGIHASVLAATAPSTSSAADEELMQMIELARSVVGAPSAHTVHMACTSTADACAVHEEVALEDDAEQEAEEPAQPLSTAAVTSAPVDIAAYEHLDYVHAPRRKWFGGASVSDDDDDDDRAPAAFQHASATQGVHYTSDGDADDVVRGGARAVDTSKTDDTADEAAFSTLPRRRNA